MYRTRSISLSGQAEIQGLIWGTICVNFHLKGRFKMQITKETIIGDILDADFGVANYFLEIGMHCLGCPASRGESIEEACAVHGTDPDDLVAKLNAHFVAKQ